MTGQKGTEFTARYINRFHEMEEGKLPCPPQSPDCIQRGRVGTGDGTYHAQAGSPAYKIAEAFKMKCEQFGIQLPEDFVKVPEYIQLQLSDFSS